MRRYLFIFLRLAIGAALLVWALKRTEFGAATRIPFHTLNLGWLVISFGFGGLAVAGWALRWMLFLKVYDIKIRYWEALRLTLFADFFNLYFLGPIGADGLRLVLMARKFPYRKAAITGSIIMDHAAGLLGGALLYLIFTRSQMAWLGAGDTGLKHAAFITADLILGGLALLTFSGLGVAVEPVLQRFIREKLHAGFLLKPLMPFAFLREHRLTLLWNFFVSVMFSLCSYMAYWAAGKSYSADFPLGKLLAIMPVVDVVAALPITVSGLGVRENLFVELLGNSLSIGAQGALMVSLLGFAANGLWGLIGGAWLAAHRLHSGTQIFASPSSSTPPCTTHDTGNAIS